MAPVMEQAAARLEPHIRVAKVNTEEEQALASSFAIRSIPTVILFRGGAEIARRSGALQLNDLTTWVESVLR
jgi:thioredoxin 2